MPLNEMLDPLTGEIEEGLLSKKPHCFRKYNDYQF